jgi:tetratricopeptide (TPR) repeat protein
VKRAYARAHALCEQIGESPYLFRALAGLFRFELIRGELQEARALVESLLRLAQAQPDTLLLPVAHLALGATLFHLGEPAAARAHLEQGLRAYDRHQQEALILQYGEDFVVVCLAYAAWARQLLGYPDQALAHGQEALALVEELSHPFTLATALAHSAYFHMFRREAQVVRARAEAAIDLVGEHGFSPVWGAWGLAGLGAVRARTGRRGDCADAAHPRCPSDRRLPPLAAV